MEAENPAAPSFELTVGLAEWAERIEKTERFQGRFWRSAPSLGRCSVALERTKCVHRIQERHTKCRPRLQVVAKGCTTNRVERVMPADNASGEHNNVVPSLYLEQYKAYLADLGNVGSRYATTNGFYMSVISALLGVLALTDSPKLFGQLQKPTLLVVCMFCVALCMLWAQTIWFYRLLFSAKFRVLRNLETHLAHPWLCRGVRYDQ
jgi:hypothetical protein